MCSVNISRAAQGAPGCQRWFLFQDTSASAQQRNETGLTDELQIKVPSSPPLPRCLFTIILAAVEACCVAHHSLCLILGTEPASTLLSAAAQAHSFH